MGGRVSADAKSSSSAEAHPAGLGAPLDIFPEGISPDELNRYRQQYQEFRAGRGFGAKGEGFSAVALKRDTSGHLGFQSTETSEKKLSKVTVLGGGAFGTAMAVTCARNGHQVTIYARDEEQCRGINTEHKNTKYLGDCLLPDNLVACSNLTEAIADAEVVFLGLPAQKTPEFLEANKDLFKPNMIMVSTAKGLYLKTKQLLSDAIIDVMGPTCPPLVLLSGPSFAKEIVDGHPTTVVCASQKLHHAVAVQRLMSSTKFRVFTSQDVIGVELGGALKNPLAVGAGIIEGLGFGINTMSAYITCATRELQMLIVAMGGRPETAAGLSGVGDLMLTAFGTLSRNRTCGMRLAKGESLDEILKGTTIEGVPTASVAVYFAEMCGLDLPIFRAVSQLILGKVKAHKAAEELMSLPLTTEFPGLAATTRPLGSTGTLVSSATSTSVSSMGR
mmetsp:Transcript_69418/g.166424  ORF Transcript_69418/g.166424 Transcript_69418/m.166424 type:complete len:446 (+) Transcript_69418:113-1450(+)|eukprot:CAMPEP_0178430828 /NCGR_PEP_ID=MMETSP0689_2-20121128/31523_1 /TAXON_ID=160604 /ORGANISM="Amphidinium massartii, Strain CS-259" /LENGTH=445 /DNA_ID=CAMNT_0020052701 /DNA_START=113 /DNA_END=1450 /DNA_ORIENTATION=+